MSPTRPIPALLNPGAGTADAAARLLARDPRFSLETVAPHRLRDAVAAHVRGGARRVLVAGGDGTLSTAAGALLADPAELAIVPAGTLNHFARGLGIPTDPEAAIRIAAGADTRRVDVGSVNGHPFLGTSSVGAYPALVRRRDRLEPRLGYTLGNAVAGLALLLRLRTFSLVLEVEGAHRSYSTPLLFVGVGERDLRLRSFGGRVDAGAPGLHAIVVRGRRPARLLALALSTAAHGVRRAAGMPELDSFVLEEFRVELAGRRSTHVALDGEIVRLEAPLRYRLLRGALTVMAPPVGSVTA
jgi:diacylglycerol kinase family enzyme